MNTIGKKIIVLLLCVFSFAASHAAEFHNESLNYVVTYKWGLIHKDAGDARLTLRNSGGKYQIVLTGKSKPWADKIYMVRDTLRCTINKNGFRPVRYEKAAHEKGKYSKDIINYGYSGGTTTASISRYKSKGGKIKTLKKNLSTNMQAFDMLSIFYYLRSLDYTRLKKGTILKKAIFSGSQKETITIKYIGLEPVTLRNKKKMNAYHIKFRFSTKGGKKSSDDMDTWISTDQSHIPLVPIGSLPVGQVRCYYIG